MENKKRGGARIGAGRKKKYDKSVRHLKREIVSRRYPMHINMKLVKGISSLRKKTLYNLFLRSISKSHTKGIRVIHFALLSNHFHLIVEADNNDILARGMQSLNISFAKMVNKHFNRKGKIFVTRYFLHILKDHLALKNAYRYVLKNYAKHLKKADIFDPFSSNHMYKHITKLFGMVRMNIKCRFKNKGERMAHFKELASTLSPPKSKMGISMEQWCF